MEVVEVSADYYRLIPSRFPPIQVFEGLVANDRLEELAAAESRTNPRLLSEERLRATIGDNSHRLQNFNHAPFKYINPEGSTFFPSYRPALEMADTRQTALAIAVARRERFLRRTNEASIGLDMRLLKTPVEGRFLDLCDVDPQLPLEKKRKIASELSDDLAGVIFRPLERPSHRCIAIVRNEGLGYTMQTQHFRFWWDGTRIAAVYAFDDSRNLDPAGFSAAEDLIAA